MKKILLLAGILLFLVSCEGPRGPQGYPGRDGQDGVISNRVIIDFEVDSWDRITDRNGLFLGWEALYDDVRDLTTYVYDNAAIVAYLETYDNGLRTQKSLPVVTNHEDNNGITWFQTIDFDYAVTNRGEGSVLFSVKNSDFRQDYPADMVFRVVFLW